MPRKRSQRLLVLDRLLSNGAIDYKYAEKRGINRLTSYIHRLRGEGYTILCLRVNGQTNYVLGEP